MGKFDRRLESLERRMAIRTMHILWIEDGETEDEAMARQGLSPGEDDTVFCVSWLLRRE